MHNPIQNGICDCRIVEQVVPLLRRKLAGDQLRSLHRLLIDDVEQDRPQMDINPANAKVVDDQQLRFHELPAQFRQRAVSLRHNQVLVKLRRRREVNGISRTARLFAESAGQPRFASSRQSGSAPDFAAE